MKAIEITDERRFEALAEAGAAPMQQRRAYGLAAQALGADLARFELREGRRTVGAVQVLVRRVAGLRFALASRGPVWLEAPDGLQRAAALRMLRRAVPGVLIITPESENATARAAGLFQVTTPGTVAVLALNGEMRARMHGKWRNRLCRAEGIGLEVEVASIPRLGWLFDADAEAQRRNGYRTLPRGFVEAWPDRILGLVARHGGNEVAAMLFLVHGSTATYHVGWTGDAGRCASAHNLLLWRAMEALQRRGVRRIDLGLLDTVNTPGLARFKLGAGSVPHRLGGTWLGF
jgi:hypothetical protein